jgi:hypothetical protein
MTKVNQETLTTDEDNSPKVKTLKFHNIAGGGIKRTIEKSIREMNGVKRTDLLKELDITAVNEQGQKIHLFLGDLAIDGFRPSYIWSDNRVNDMRSRVAMYTALALMTDRDEASFVVMTGLPLLHLAALKDEYEKNLPGTMEITFNAGPWEGKTKKITILKSKATAQGFGIYLNNLLHLDGSLGRPELAKGSVGIIDTGFRTTNLLYIRDGEPKDLYSEQTEDGMNVVHQRIQQFINDNGGVIPIEEIEKIYDTNKYEIANGTVIDFEMEKIIALGDLSNRISQNANRLWTIENMRSIIVAGGGGSAIYENLNYKQKLLSENSQFGNSLGYLKAVIRQLNKSDEFKGKDVIPVGLDSGFGYMKVAVLV